MTKIIFMGTPDFAVPTLEMLIYEGYDIIGVVTQPDKPKGRKKELTASPVKLCAKKHNLPIFQPTKLRTSDELTDIIGLSPDIVITAAYGQILPESLLCVPTFGCINVHASLLPKYRGGAPIHHAIMNGESETGITIMYMVKELDAGDIIAQQSIPILPSDHVGTLHNKLSLLGADLLQATLPKILSNNIKPLAQDPTHVSYASNIKREDEAIIWSRTALEILQQIKGLHPWPVAFSTWKNKILKIWWAEAITDNKILAMPGEIVQVADNILEVATGQGTIFLDEVQLAGRSRMGIAEFIRGYAPVVGDILGKDIDSSS